MGRGWEGWIVSSGAEKDSDGGDVKETYITFLWSLADDHVLHSHEQGLEFELEHKHGHGQDVN